MTNEEKAMELFPDMRTLECFCKDARGKLIEMAEWKDSEFAIERRTLIEKIASLKEQRAVLRASNEKFRKEFLDKACKWLIENIDISKRPSHIVMDFRKYMEEE